MECNCNNNNSNGGVIPWVRGNRLPLIICVYENVVTQEQVGDSTLTVNEMTRVPYTIQDNDTVTVIMKSGFRQVAMPFTTDGNKVMVTDNGELPTGAYTVEVTIERGDGARGRWQETRQVRIYENTSDAQLGEMYSIDADLFFYAKGDTGTGIADITNNPDGTLTITMTDGTSYTTEALKGDKGDKGDTGERGVSIVSFDVTGQTDVSVIYTVTFSDDTTQDISVPKGPQGDTGLTGNGISTTTLNSDYTLTIAYTDGTTYTTPSIRGAQGAQGVSVIGFTQTGETATNTMYNLVFSDGRTQSVAIPKGVKGDKGEPGPQGAQGPKGDTVTATDYTLYNAQGSDSQGAMSQDATTKAISAQTGYYTCGTVSGTAEKVVTVESGNLYKRTLGGQFKVKMTNKNTAASGVTLQVGSETATTLWYNGAAVSASNTWDAGDVISVYYDGTYYQASNAQGGSNKKIDAYLYGDLRTLAVGQVYNVDEAVKTTNKQLRRITKEITPLSLSEALTSGSLKTSGNATYRAARTISIYNPNPSTPYSAGAYTLGIMTVYTLTVTAETVTAGSITVNETEVAVEATDDASAIASNIANALVIDGWTTSVAENVVTVRCNTIGNNTTTITIDVGDTGVVVSGNSTPSVAGTDVIMKYDGESWTEAEVGTMATDDVLVEVDEAWLIANATMQNSVVRDTSLDKELYSIPYLNVFSGYNPVLTASKTSSTISINVTSHYNDSRSVAGFVVPPYALGKKVGFRFEFKKTAGDNTNTPLYFFGAANTYTRLGVICTLSGNSGFVDVVADVPQSTAYIGIVNQGINKNSVLTLSGLTIYEREEQKELARKTEDTSDALNNLLGTNYFDLEKAVIYGSDPSKGTIEKIEDGIKITCVSVSNQILWWRFPETLKMGAEYIISFDATIKGGTLSGTQAHNFDIYNDNTYVNQFIISKNGHYEKKLKINGSLYRFRANSAYLIGRAGVSIEFTNISFKVPTVNINSIEDIAEDVNSLNDRLVVCETSCKDKDIHFFEVEEDGLYFVDKYLNIGGKFDSNGFHAININE